MDLNQLSPFPEWEDENYDHIEGEEWKSTLKNSLAKKLYNQWLQVYVLIESVCENLYPTHTASANSLTLPVSENYLKHLKETVIADASIIPSKISGAEAGDLYVLRMENASIIRKTAMDVFNQCAAFKVMGIGKFEEIEIVLKEIELFREHFIEWVASFERDEFEDEWGLF